MKQEEKKLPAGLEEAAEKHIQSVVDAAGHPGWDWETQDIVDAFIAGAEWQKAKMLEKAVDGRYMKADGKVYVESWLLDIDPDSVKAGDEVRLIILPKED